ncbi:hypothetical protein RCL_jg20239.t1 [Rhizophagus clarus]|uniref:Uncharacterized protein n=1 Tax=Rhizophagus clarus TaxID=94130 RepID=A0A8H3KW08_9GLOM|nr:hypothetical protein RCL_jg20239.t1 [Rhizophagus clarus]
MSVEPPAIPLSSKKLTRMKLSGLMDTIKKPPYGKLFVNVSIVLVYIVRFVLLNETTDPDDKKLTLKVDKVDESNSIFERVQNWPTPTCYSRRY